MRLIDNIHPSSRSRFSAMRIIAISVIAVSVLLPLTAKRANANGRAADRPAKAAASTAASPQNGEVVINELQAANVDMLLSPARNFNSWIELYNTTEHEIKLAGCYLTDDKANPTRWKMPADIGTLPAKGYKLIWMGSNDIKTTQANFSLDCEGGAIYLYNSTQTLIDEATYPEAISRASYARNTDGCGSWMWTAEPTPGKSNNDAPYCSSRLDAPVVDTDGGFFTNRLHVTVEMQDGAKLYYTTNGETPTKQNAMESSSGEFDITKSTTLRLRFFSDGMLPSPVTTRTYLKRDYNHTLPAIIVNAPSRYLYSDSMGIYTRGTAGCTGNGQATAANWNMNWDRPVNFQLVLPDGTMAVNQDVDMAISGGWTRSNDTKSFKLKADRAYEGQNYYLYPFFDAKPFNRNRTLQARYGGNDTYCRIKDAALQTILQQAGLNLDLVSYQPAVHYINGVYKGLINMREPNNKDFAYANWGLSKQDLEVFEQSPDSGQYMMLGTSDVIDRLWELSETADQASSYEEILQILDIDEYINYMAAELYMNSWDWPDNNVKAYRRKDGGRYRFVLFDVDAAFEAGGNVFEWIDGMQWHTYDYIYDLGTCLYGEIKFCTFFLNMLEKRADFRQKITDAISVMAGSVFTKSRADLIMEQLAERVRTTMSWEGASPDGSLSTISNAIDGRTNTIRSHIADYERLQQSLNKSHSVKISSNIGSLPRLYLNQTIIPYAQFDGYIYSPATLRVEVPAGYRFDGWREATTKSEVIVPWNATWKYYDKGSLDGTSWYKSSYSDTKWSEGSAPLGYGKDLIATTIDYGSNASAKRTTYYFRHTLSLDEAPTDGLTLKMDYKVDDGFILYVNGTEVATHRISSGASYADYASTAESNPDEGSIEISASLLKRGNNVIAVEVHNNTAWSTDIVWDAQFSICGEAVSNKTLSSQNSMTLPDSNCSVMACFHALSDSEREAAGLTPIVVNELSAANSVAANEYFKRNDWVELYNTTSDSIDLSGMYLTDDAADLHKYCINGGSNEASTIIAPHGYKVIWCDKLAPLSQLHASFKLSASGGIVAITAADDSWTDSIAYPKHDGDQTVGRYPDGASSVYTLTLPTIGAANQLTSYSVAATQPDPSGIHHAESAATSDFRLTYAANRLVLRSSTAQKARLEIYTTTGAKIEQTSIAIRAAYADYSIAHLPQGCYIARATSNNGQLSVTKFVVNK